METLLLNLAISALGTHIQILAAAGENVNASFSRLNYLTLGLYLAFMLCIGFYFSRREKSTDDFFLGGRRVYWWAAGISIFGTQLSAITFMSIPAKAYDTDWTYILIHVSIVLVAPVVAFFYLPFFRRLNLTTAYQYLEKRFNVAVRMFGAIAFSLMQLGRMGIVLFLPAIALSTVTGLNIYICILIMGLFCTIYTTLGGIEAVIWTDVFQVVILLGGAIAAVVVIALRVDGGLPEIIDIGRQAEKFNIINWTWDWRTTAVWVVLVGNLFSNLVPYSADQTVIQRYLTTSTEKQARRAIWTNAAMTLPAGVIFFFLGTALYVFYRTFPQNLDPNLKTDAILPWFIVNELPTGLAGVVVAAIFAATMSSLDSSMNSIATVFVTDFYRRLRPDSADRFRLLLARIITVVLGVFATGCALLLDRYRIESLWDLFLQILGLLGGTLAGVFVLGIFTRRANSLGAMIGIVCSALALFYVKLYTQIHFLLYGAIGIITCLCVGYLGSLFVRSSRPSQPDLTVYGLFKRAED
jgi:SSS family solute:Na+ symporter